MSWDNIKRRKSDFEDQEDHDRIIKLVEIAANQQLLLANHVDNYQGHLKDDKENFKEINDKLANLVNTKYLVLGGFIVINFIFKLWH